MIIVGSILGVDGESSVSITDNDPRHVLRFLETHDHEGAGITVRFRADDELAYHLLHALVAQQAEAEDSKPSQ
jgi:hypothetical protein